jgi:hypothetical protein
MERKDYPTDVGDDEWAPRESDGVMISRAVGHTLLSRRAQATADVSPRRVLATTSCPLCDASAAWVPGFFYTTLSLPHP